MIPMMNWGRDNFTRSSKNKLAWPGLLFLFLIIVYVIGPFLFSKGNETVSQIIRPFLKTADGLKIKSKEKSLTDEKIKALEKENSFLKLENKELKKKYGLKNDGNTLLARVISRPPQSLYDTLIIDTANISKERLREGAAVFSNGVIIGTLAQINQSSAKVLLFSSNGYQLKAILANGSTTPIELSGQGGGAFRAILPQSIPLKKGELVTLPEYDGSLAAEVYNWKRDEKSLSNVIYLRAPVNFHSIIFAEIGLDE